MFFFCLEGGRSCFLLGGGLLVFVGVVVVVVVNESRARHATLVFFWGRGGKIGLGGGPNPTNFVFKG